MSGQVEFQHLRRGLQARLRDLRSLELSVVGCTSGSHSNAIAEYCVVQLLDVWSRFVRDIVLASASGRAVDRRGGVVRPGPVGPLRQSYAMTHLRANWPTRKNQPLWWEPKWFDLKSSNYSLDVLLPSNAFDLKTALGSNTNPTEHVRAVRNFCAHRGQVSANALKASLSSWGPKDWSQPRDLVFHRPVGLDSVFQGWCESFDLVSAAMT